MTTQPITSAEPPSGDCIVFAFLSTETGVEMSALAPFKATREAIEARYGGQVLEGTAQSVDPSDLDAHGRYRRQPTGWGDLGS